MGVVRCFIRVAAVRIFRLANSFWNNAVVLPTGFVCTGVAKQEAEDSCEYEAIDKNLKLC